MLPPRGYVELVADAKVVKAMATDPVASAPSGEVSRLNSANALTLLRLLLVPAFVALFFAGGSQSPGWLFAAAGVFVLAAITDRIDGELARRWNLETDFGKVADPIADKALTGAALVSLSIVGALAWWMTAAILVREWGITLLRLLIIRHGIIPASHGGKIKTTLQVVAITVYVVPYAVLPYGHVLATARIWLMVAAVVVTLGTGLEYVVQAVRMRRASLQAEERAGRGPRPEGHPDTSGRPQQGERDGGHRATGNGR